MWLQNILHVLCYRCHYSQLGCTAAILMGDDGNGIPRREGIHGSVKQQGIFGDLKDLQILLGINLHGLWASSLDATEEMGYDPRSLMSNCIHL